MAAQWMVIIVCGLLIGLALYVFIRWIRRMAKGRCCESCSGCPQSGRCDIEQRKQKKKDIL